MTNYIAEDVNFIAQRLKEIETEKALTRARPDQEFGVVVPAVPSEPVKQEPGHYSYF